MLKLTRFRMLKYIGSGRYGIVGKAVHCTSAQDVICKQVRNVFRAGEGKVYVIRTLREIGTMCHMRHPNVVKLMEIVDPPENKAEYNHIYVVMENINGFDLRRCLSFKETAFKREQVRFMIYQCVAGMKYMAECGIMHRDLKPENVLVRWDCVVKIADFGFARGLLSDQEISEIEAGVDSDLADPSADSFVKKQYRRLSTHVVTRWYRAPELLVVDPIYGMQSDVWSLGVMFGEMMELMTAGDKNALRRVAMFDAVASRLSPVGAMDRANPECPQVEAIAQVIGPPQEDDFPRLEAKVPTMAAYFKKLRDEPAEGATSLKAKYPHWAEEDLSLVQKCLQWNPEKRPTMAQLLADSYFDEVRSNTELYGNMAQLVENTPNHPLEGKMLEYMTGPTLRHLSKDIEEDAIEENINALAKEFASMQESSDADPSTSMPLVPPSLDLALTNIKELNESSKIDPQAELQKVKDSLEPMDAYLRIKGWAIVQDAIIKKLIADKVATPADRKAKVKAIEPLFKTGEPSALVAGLQAQGYDVAALTDKLADALVTDAKKSLGGKCKLVDWGALLADVETSVKKVVVAEAPPASNGGTTATAKGTDTVVRSAEKPTPAGGEASGQSACCVVS